MKHEAVIYLNSDVRKKRGRKMKHKPSIEDLNYLNSFQIYKIDASMFHHREHLQIAYTLLAERCIEDAYRELKNNILALLTHLGVGTEKYHETMPYAWLLAVKHFMAISAPCNSFKGFIESNSILLDKTIMSAHYSNQLMSSKLAKEKYVQPDLEPIPLHTEKIA